MNLTGNVVLLTGGSTGIGFSLAQALVIRGNRVLVCGRRQGRLDEARAKVPQLETFACDIGTFEGRQALFAWSTHLAPQLNVLINNAGVQHRIDLLNPPDVRRPFEEIAINLEAPIHLSMLFIPHLRKMRNPAIVNVSSGLAFVPNATTPLYCATKAALHSFSLSLRHQLRSTSIGVYEVIPPLVESELHAHQGVSFPPNLAMPTDKFVAAMLEGLEADVLTHPIGMAKQLHEQPEKMFAMMNPS